MDNNTLFATIRYALALCIMLLSGISYAQVECTTGQSCTQNITLRPGWNSIFVQVKPDNSSTETIFSDLLDGTGPQIDSVWKWMSHKEKVGYLVNPDTGELLKTSGWLRYLPKNNSQSFLTNLHIIQVNKSYLVKLNGTENVTLTITGTPVVPRNKWVADSYNHVGFHIDPLNPPTFSDYFSTDPAHTNQSVYKLINNAWKKVDTFNTHIEPDVAYWVFSKGSSDYNGTIDFDLPMSGQINFVKTIKQLISGITNNSNNSSVISMRVIGNVAGLMYENPDLTSSTRWLALPQSHSVVINANDKVNFPLSINRADFYPGTFNEILEVTSDTGSRWLIPVAAQAPVLQSLWIGEVKIENVAQVQNYKKDCLETIVDGIRQPNENTAGPANYDLCIDADGLPVSIAGEALSPVAQNFSFRFIVHRDAASQVRLLKSVIQMWKDPVMDASGTEIEAGRFVLLTDDSLISNYKGVTMRDGEVVGRRIGTVAYDFPGEALDMTGDLDASMTAILNLGSNAPTNPFRHHYHPNHNGLANDYVTENTEAYAITRTMNFMFTGGNGTDIKTGTYREEVTGLHKNPVVVTGTFELRHSVSVNELNQ